MLIRKKFSEVFFKNPDGSLTPKIVINVNGITFGPGVSFGKGVNFAGVDFFQYENLDIAGELKEGVLIIKGFFNI